MKDDWRKILLKEMNVNKKLVLIGSCLENYKDDKERIGEWENNGFSRRSFYDYKSKFVQKCAHISKMSA